MESQVHEDYREASRIDRAGWRYQGCTACDSLTFKKSQKYLRKLKLLQGGKDS